MDPGPLFGLLEKQRREEERKRKQEREREKEDDQLGQRDRPDSKITESEEGTDGSQEN